MLQRWACLARLRTPALARPCCCLGAEDVYVHREQNLCHIVLVVCCCRNGKGPREAAAPPPTQWRGTGFLPVRALARTGADTVAPGSSGTGVTNCPTS